MNGLPLTQPFPTRVIQLFVVAGVTIVVLSFLWLALTLPVSTLVQQFQSDGLLSSDANNTVTFINLFVTAFGLLAGLSILAWGWIKSVEEREYGFALPD